MIDTKKLPVKTHLYKNKWGFDMRDADLKVRPQDDFYHYVNGNWLKKNPIPPHESRWGSFLVLRYETEKKVRAIVEKVNNMKHLKVGSAEQMIRDFYLSGLNIKKRNILGLTPLRQWFDLIDKIKDIDSLVLTMAHLEKVAGAGPWGLMVDQDIKDSEKYIIYIHQSGLGMPDRDYYIKYDTESVRVRTAYEKHLEAIFTLMGKSKSEAMKGREIVMRIETNIAKISMPKEDLRDVDKIYHKMNFSGLARLTPNINWSDYFKIVGTGTVDKVIVMQPNFLKKINLMMTKESIENWKIYFTWQLVGGSASCLSSKFEKQNFAFYGTVLSGTKVMKPAWRRALSVVNSTLGELLGKLYVDAYFGPEAKKIIVEVVEDLFEAYEIRIKNLEWMSSTTKKKALQKLHQITPKLGYPKKWRSYKGLLIKSGDYFDNIIRVKFFEHQRLMRRLKKPVDRSEWFMTPQTVNAYYSPSLNDIVFPAAILQPPFFSKDADYAINYGAIGTVIGHEITHGFDDQGSKFDGKGNRKTWWTKKDRKSFDTKAKVLVNQFNFYTVADGLKVNGKMTLGENIADLGGASIAFDAFKLRLAKIGRNDIDGLTPEQRFFLGFALFERENRRPEAEKIQVLTDPHSPGIYRINGPASNLPEFYTAFGVKKGDKLYREVKDRAKIW